MPPSTCSPRTKRPRWAGLSWLVPINAALTMLSSTLVRLRFGEKVAAPDPSEYGGNEAFQSSGGTHRRRLSKGEWANVKRSGAVLPAGQICPTAKPYSSDPNATPGRYDPGGELDRGHKEHRLLRPVRCRGIDGGEGSSCRWCARPTTSWPATGRAAGLQPHAAGHKWFEQGINEKLIPC